MGPEGKNLVNSSISVFQQGLTHSAITTFSSYCHKIWGEGGATALTQANIRNMLTKVGQETIDKDFAPKMKGRQIVHDFMAVISITH